MPTRSPAQRRLMAAAAHTKGGYAGVPQSVGREFLMADKMNGLIGGAIANSGEGGTGVHSSFNGMMGTPKPYALGDEI